ncbi:MAG: M28 family peptidase [Candidatus Krumholzibacteria bacterium]|nr:M28 family peptidase [Candidatus Krumholzibacteria bacterium]
MSNRGFNVGLIVAVTLVLSVTTGVADDAKKEPGEARFLTNPRALTYQGKRAGEGYFSHDERHVIFQDERESDNPFYQIYVMSLETGETHRVSTGLGKTTCAFFRPGTDEVIFASTHLDPDAKKKQVEEIEFRASGKKRRYSFDYDETFDIFSARRDGSDMKRLTSTSGYDAECAYSPDGNQIVFCSIRDAYPVANLSKKDQKQLQVDASYFGEVYIMDADGSNARRLTNWEGYDGGPFFSPDGTRILWRHFDESGMVADVYTMRLDGSDRRQLTDFDSMSWAPYYHPSGSYVIFTSNKLGFSNFELYIVDAQGIQEPVRVTFTDGFDGLPVFSPDGRRLMWTSNRSSSKKSQLFLARWNHAAALQALQLTAVAANQAGDVSRYSADISAADLSAHVEYLASDQLEGRMTGSQGARMAGDYIADRFKELALEPLDEEEGYFQVFPFTSGVEIDAGGCRLSVSDGANSRNGHELKVERDFRPLAFAENDEVEGSIVFAGYGLNVPDNGQRGHESYSGLDVKDKVVMVLRYVPEGVDTERRRELNHYAGLRYKAMVAREKGAKAILMVGGPNSPNAGELIPLKFDQSSASSGIVAASISGEVAQMILTGAGKDLHEVQSGLDDENPHFEGTFEIPDVRVKIATSVNRTKKDGRNVIGMIPPAKRQSETEYLLIGAHYDHIGYGEIGSLAHKDEEGQIHNGADDNASGTATVLEVAAALAELKMRSPAKFRRGVIVALWSGEELGTVGSSYFVSHSPTPLDRIVAYLNFDMVGRLRDNKLTMQGVGSSTLWPELIEKRNVPAGFDLTLQQDPYLPTDVSPFYPKEVPVLSFFTGSHEDYNRPTDDWATLDYDGMERIATFALGMLTDLIDREQRPQYAEVQQTKSPQGQRASLRAYLGTIPDYATDGIEGVKLSGTRAGGPADLAGVQGGDIIIELDGQKITNIYDYTYALDAVKIGKAVEIVVLRNDKRVTLTITPETRK